MQTLVKQIEAAIEVLDANNAKAPTYWDTIDIDAVMHFANQAINAWKALSPEAIAREEHEPATFAQSFEQEWSCGLVELLTAYYLETGAHYFDEYQAEAA